MEYVYCKVCRQVIEGAKPFVTGGKTRFVMHPACSDKVLEGASAVGGVVKSLVELRRPGFFESPLLRGVVAAAREMTKK